MTLSLLVRFGRPTTIGGQECPRSYARVLAGQPMPGLFEVGPAVPIATAIEDLLLIAE